MSNIEDSLVYLNGSLTRRSEAKISVMDRGFLFGDGIYEVIPVYQRKLFRPEQHLARLFRGLSEMPGGVFVSLFGGYQRVKN